MKPYRSQIIYLTLAAFFGTLSYPFTRTSAAPFFNAAYGAHNLAWAMIAAATLAVIVVVIYNRLAKRFALIPLCICAMLCIIVITLFFAFIMGRHPRWMALLYYAWSDVYILILVEQFWSISNTLFDKATAKKYYGVFLTGGAFGSMAGNGLAMKLAEPFGSENMIFLCCLFLGLFTLLIYLLNRSINARNDLKPKFNIEHNLADSSTFGGASLVFKSRYLTLIAILILATQLYINGSYFIFNSYLSELASTVDKQSALYGKTFFFVQIITITCSVAITPLSLRFFGVAKTHLGIVGMIILIFCAATLHPGLALVAILFIVAKGFDYSIFRAAKEMLYLPLHIAEKFQAKSFIDVFVYRFSKAGAALLLILIQGTLNLSPFYLVGFGIALWFVTIILLLRIYNHLNPPDNVVTDETASSGSIISNAR
jgi:AAA family ATP:ADP antiporter